MNKTLFSILNVLNTHKGSRYSINIARELNIQEYKLLERAVRYYLKQLDDHGYTVYTEKGEINLAHFDKKSWFDGRMNCNPFKIKKRPNNIIKRLHINRMTFIILMLKNLPPKWIP